MKDRKEIFDEVLETFENDDIREFAKKVIDNAPPYFFEVPASSSHKYHPAYACETPLGLAKHTVALIRILNHMWGVECINTQFTSRERDLLRVAGIAHDMMKSGTQEEYEKSKWTKFDHPLLAAKMVYGMDGLTKEERKFIAMAISSHMGQWNTDKRNPEVVLPTPQDKYQIILHLADYLASRKDIEIKFNSTEQKSATPSEPAPDINTWKFPWGKYAGKTIPEVAAENKGYIRWAKENMDKEPAKSLLASFDY